MSRHMILSLGRSGSNTLADLINQHPHALNVGEVLGSWTKMRQIRESFCLYAGRDAAYLDAVTRPSALLFAANTFRSMGRLTARME